MKKFGKIFENWFQDLKMEEGEKLKWKKVQSAEKVELFSYQTFIF